MTNKSWSTFYFPFSLSKPTNDKFQAERLVLTRSRTLLPTSSVTLIGIIPSLATLWQTASPDASPLTCSRCVYLKPVAPPPTGVFKWGVLLLVFPHLSQCYFCVMFSFVFSFCYILFYFFILFFLAWNPQRESRDLASLVVLSLQSLRSVHQPEGCVFRGQGTSLCVFFYLVFNFGEKCWFIVDASRQPHPAGPAHLAGKRREREDNLFDQQTPRLCLLISFP